jgi:AraC-like DNA-binding protein
VGSRFALAGHRRLIETRWTYIAGAPSKTLEAWGGVFGGFCERAATPVDRLELPAAAWVMILCCGEPVTVGSALNPGSTRRLDACSAGLQVPAQRVVHAGINDCVEIRLPPLAAYALFGGAMTEANSEAINLLEVAPGPIAVLLDRLRTATAWAERLAAVDRYLSRGLAQSTRRIPPELGWAWRTLEQTRGQIEIRSLAKNIGWSERHLVRRFVTYFGVRPKAIARRLRFSHAFDLLSAQSPDEIRTIALDAGFSDQSHMTREFQTLAGVTPNVLKAARFKDLPGIPAAVLLDR